MASIVARVRAFVQSSPGLSRGLFQARLGLAIVTSLAGASLVLPLVLPDANASDFSLANASDNGPPRPSFAHWLGTDALHRDELARLAAGGRVSLAVGLVASLIAIALGVGAGVGAATLRKTGARWADRAVVGLCDVLLALPFLLFVTSIGVVTGRTTLASVILVLGATSAVGVARIVRARALEVLERDFVVAARALGASRRAIAFEHVLPNMAGTALVLATNLAGAMILAEAVLSYLAVGVAPPLASWGRMVHEAEPATATRPLLLVAPGLCIVFAAGGFFRIGEAIRAGFDPRAPRSLARVPLDLLTAGLAAAVLLLVPPPELAAPRGAATPTPHDGGALRLATFVNVGSLDSALANDEIAVAIGRHVFGRLLRWDALGRVSGDLAQSYAWSEDGKTLTLVLEEGLVFHDGRPLAAPDVKRSIERALHPKSGCPQASLYTNLVGFDAYRSGKATELSGVRVVGARGVAFDLVRPSATFLPLLTMGYVAPVCPSSPAIADRRSTALPCGAGPYVARAIEPEERILLERFGGYHESGLPHIASIEMRINVRPSAQRFRFERGELDFVRDLSGADVTLYADDARYSASRAWVDVAKTDAVFLNTELEPFDRPAVRRAVALALDASVLERIRPDVRAVDRVVPAALPGPDRSTPLRRHDLPAALEAMAEAGFAFDPVTGQGGYPDVVDYVTVADTFEQQAAEIFREQLAKIGIRVRLDLESYQAYLAKVSRRKTAKMGWSSWGADFPDPANFFDPVLSSRAIGDASENPSFFSNPTLDHLLDEAESTSDPSARMRSFERAEEVVAHEAPWIPVYSTRSLQVWQPRLAGYVPNPLAPLDFSRAWLGGDP